MLNSIELQQLHHLISSIILKVEGLSLKNYVKIMQENSFKFFIYNYWRCVDKKILFCFLILFFLGLFFSFSSTSSLAGERLNKDYYFFFLLNILFLQF